MELAERLPRLWAALIDRLLVLPLILVTGFLLPYGLARNGNGIAAIIASVTIFLGLVGYQMWLLTTQGQTIGKRLLKIRIVLIKDLSNGGFVANVLLRGVVPWVITLIPGLGILFSVCDPSFIFREDRRCIHDHIAGTCVIKAS
ncbi:MAG: RDD family protein [Elusimicrobiota bacterium]|nr:MAG: RDD family protein [Elusimicrobiota bacterium]